LGDTFSLPPEARRVLILVNPKAGRRSPLGRVDRLVASLRQHEMEVEVLDAPGEAAEQANRLQERGELRAVVGVGGDGTAAELVNRTCPGVPITLLPAGTANLLAKYFRMPRRPESLAGSIIAGRCRRMDAGRAGGAAGRIFLLMASCGFDAEVVRTVHALRDRFPHGGHIGYASYLKPIFATIRNYEYPQLRIYCDEPDRGHSAGRPLEPVLARWAFVINVSRYGWGLNLAPQAVTTDALLDVCTFRRGSLCSGLWYLAAAQLGGWHGRLSDCVSSRARRIRIESDHRVPYQLDGDPGGWLPLEIEVLPERTTLVLPPAGELPP